MDALIDVCAPRDQAEGTRSQVLRWLKSVGDRIERDEPLVELETDKVTVEMAAPAAGVLREILKGARQEVAPGDLLARLEPPAAADAGPAAWCSAASDASGTADTGTTSGPADAPAGHDVVPVSASTRIDATATVAPASAAAKLSPAVRRLMRERGLDPARIAGTGKGGRITAADVERQSIGGRPGAPEPAVERIEHTPMRRRIAARMVESLLHTAPHVTSVFEVDLGQVLAHRERQRAGFAERGATLTLTAYFVLACVDAIRAVPEANARWTDEALEVHRQIDVGVATDLGGRGLIVPVLRRVEQMDLFQVASGLADLTHRAREERLTPADVRGGTFTVSNHGVSGSLVATPIVIHQPQSAILGIGRMEKRVVVSSRDGQDAIAIRPRCYVSLTIDHRVMDGARANRFLTTLVERLENWS